MTADNIIVILIIAVAILAFVITVQPIVYMYIISQRLERIAEENRARFENFSYALGQLQLDRAGNQDVQAEIEHSLDYLSREVAAGQESHKRIQFMHMWVQRLDDKFTLLNLNISEAVELLREAQILIKADLDSR